MGLSKLQRAIWEQKYRNDNETYDKYLWRISAGNEAIRDLIEDNKFSFGGRILAGRGVSGRKMTTSNCYVLGLKDDSLESIYHLAGEMARTYSRGGGVGITLDGLRPNGANVNNSGQTSPGAVSFMEVFDMTTRNTQAGNRRGALMMCMSTEHPDIMEFIDVKTTNDKITAANISVKASDSFMNAVVKGLDWTASFDTPYEKFTTRYRADDLLTKLAKNNWNWAEPGMLFIDKINQYNFVNYIPEYKMEATNPCGEQPLPVYGACLLGSINLSKFVYNKFTPDATFSYVDFEKAIMTAIGGLNEVLMETIDGHPLMEQRDFAHDFRPVGLGVMGMADAIIKLGIKYGSDEHIEFIHKFGSVMLNAAVAKSALIAAENGHAHKGFDKDKIKNTPMYDLLSNETKELVQQHGLANATLLSIAPTGTISTAIGVSGGVEPIFAKTYMRKTESLHGGRDEYYEVFTPIVDEINRKLGLVPDYVVTAEEVPYMERIRVQSALQKYIDTAISSTVNLPEDTTVEEVKHLYIEAWRHGLKGITVFRSGCARLGILTKTEKNEEQEKIGEGCPECGAEIAFTNGCKTCTSCSWSACSI